MSRDKYLTIDEKLTQQLLITGFSRLVGRLEGLVHERQSLDGVDMNYLRGALNEANNALKTVSTWRIEYGTDSVE